MISGRVTAYGTPEIFVTLANQQWPAIIDTGFNGDLELPESARPLVNPRFIGRTRFLLAAGQAATEDLFLVDFDFDGQSVLAEATFNSASSSFLIGTGILKAHRLEIHFPNRTLTLARVK